MQNNSSSENSKKIKNAQQNASLMQDTKNCIKNAKKSLENSDFCVRCGTSVAEILETGFVGCEKCYELPAVKNAIDKMFGGKRHKV